MNKNAARFVPTGRRKKRLFVVATGLAVVVVLGLGFWYFQPENTHKTDQKGVPQTIRMGPGEIQLTSAQLPELKIGPVTAQSFESRREAIGIIDFNQDKTVQVFSPYQGRISKMMVRAGDDVARGQVLYTVQIPDIATAAAALISTAGTLKVATQTLRRAQALYESQSIPLKELQQNTADQQAADAANRAARKTLALFGLTDKDIENAEIQRNVDTEMSVRSPFAGRVTARAGAASAMRRRGNSPAAWRWPKRRAIGWRSPPEQAGATLAIVSCLKFASRARRRGASH